MAVGGERIIKFVGLGPYGAAARNRAELLHAVGLGARPGDLRRGFLELEFVPGRPLDRAIDQEDAARMGDYVGQVARAFPSGDALDADTLASMIETNVRELTGHGSPSFAADVRARAKQLGGLPTAEIDADERTLRIVEVDARHLTIIPLWPQQNAKPRSAGCRIWLS